MHDSVDILVGTDNRSSGLLGSAPFLILNEALVFSTIVLVRFSAMPVAVGFIFRAVFSLVILLAAMVASNELTSWRAVSG